MQRVIAGGKLDPAYKTKYIVVETTSSGFVQSASRPLLSESAALKRAERLEFTPQIPAISAIVVAYQDRG